MSTQQKVSLYIYIIIYIIDIQIKIYKMEVIYKLFAFSIT